MHSKCLAGQVRQNGDAISINVEANFVLTLVNIFFIDLKKMCPAQDISESCAFLYDGRSYPMYHVYPQDKHGPLVPVSVQDADHCGC